MMPPPWYISAPPPPPPTGEASPCLSEPSLTCSSSTIPLKPLSFLLYLTRDLQKGFSDHSSPGDAAWPLTVSHVGQFQVQELTSPPPALLLVHSKFLPMTPSCSELPVQASGSVVGETGSGLLSISPPAWSSLSPWPSQGPHLLAHLCPRRGSRPGHASR